MSASARAANDDVVRLVLKNELRQENDGRSGSFFDLPCGQLMRDLHG